MADPVNIGCGKQPVHSHEYADVYTSYVPVNTGVYTVGKPTMAPMVFTYAHGSTESDKAEQRLLFNKMEYPLKIPFPTGIDYSSVPLPVTSFSEHPLVKGRDIGKPLPLFDAHLSAASCCSTPVMFNDTVLGGGGTPACDIGCFYLGCDLLVSSDATDGDDYALVDYGNGLPVSGCAREPLPDEKQAEKRVPKRRACAERNKDICHRKGGPYTNRNKGVYPAALPALPSMAGAELTCTAAIDAPLPAILVAGGRWPTSGDQAEGHKKEDPSKISNTRVDAAALPNLPSMAGAKATLTAATAAPMHALLVAGGNGLPSGDSVQPRMAENDHIITPAILFSQIEHIVGPKEKWPVRIYNIFISRRLTYMNVLLIALFTYINKVPESLACAYLEANGVRKIFVHNLSSLHSSFANVSDQFKDYYAFNIRHNRFEYVTGEERAA